MKGCSEVHESNGRDCGGEKAATLTVTDIQLVMRRYFSNRRIGWPSMFFCLYINELNESQRKMIRYLMTKEDVELSISCFNAKLCG